MSIMLFNLLPIDYQTESTKLIYSDDQLRIYAINATKEPLIFSNENYMWLPVCDGSGWL